MSATGPELPPHLVAKRKRQQEEAQKDAAATASGANQDSPKDKRQRVAAPELPPTSKSPTVTGPSTPPTQEEEPAVRRVVGPAPPPAPLDERPLEPPNSDSDDDSDDDFGPSLPSAADAEAAANGTLSSMAQPIPEPVKTQRDEWMTLPPQQDDLAARMDPSKLRSRGFNTGKSARGGGAAGASGIGAAWTETPEQKLKRLQDEAMGVNPVAAPGVDARNAALSKEKEAEAKRLRKLTEKARGPSLMDRHKETKPEEKEDDPSKRAFDREKDIGGAMIDQAAKKELLNNASNFTSKFAGGGYL